MLEGVCHPMLRSNCLGGRGIAAYPLEYWRSSHHVCVRGMHCVATLYTNISRAKEGWPFDGSWGFLRSFNWSSDSVGHSDCPKIPMPIFNSDLLYFSSSIMICFIFYNGS